ncbi:PEP-CTERM sorting domain-containing protein [Vibrio sp. HN007]|uniref:PEP-CTERM sorting domain-containing protein n=1 Tax=Vibrio iocasae TaxID=3098914 RepID=UPI0035D3E4D3
MLHKSVKVLALGTALALSSGYASAAHLNLVAENTLMGFSFDAGGTASTKFVTFTTIDYTGSSIVDITDTNGNGFIDSGDEFTDYGAMTSISGNASGNDVNGTTGLPDGEFNFGAAGYQLSASFTNWTGEFTNPTGASTLEYDFASGDVVWNVQTITTGGFGAPTILSTTPLLTASVIEGSGDLEATPGGDGEMNVIFAITDVEIDNAFYVDFNGDGIITEDEDVFDRLAAIRILLAIPPGDPIPVASFELLPPEVKSQLQYGLSSPTTNLLSDPDLTQAVDAINTATGESFDAADAIAANTISTGDEIMVVDNDGSFVVRAIPEPGMLGLMGLAFLGLAGFQRRRKHS